MKVLWSPLAEQRALEAVEHIAPDRPNAAAAWLEELLERVATLDRFPKRGRVVREIGLPTHREILHEPYRVIYRVDTQREAFEWYRARSGDAAADFLSEVDAALDHIAEAPDRFPVVRGRLRRLLLRRFPYAVYYKVYPAVISVVGVIDGHRHPDVWLRRAAP